MKAKDLKPGMKIRLSNNSGWGFFAGKSFKIIELLDDRFIKGEVLDDLYSIPKGTRGYNSIINLDKNGFTVISGHTRRTIPWL